MAYPLFMLMRQETPTTPRPWRICETTMTSDGPRTRICDGTWTTKEEALRELQKRERGER